jgi:hypothetical protein
MRQAAFDKLGTRLAKAQQRWKCPASGARTSEVGKDRC